MLTGELRNQIDSIWNDFWSGGISNPLQVIEQITYLIFFKRLDEMQQVAEEKSTTLGKPIERRIFPEGYDGRAKRGAADQRGELCEDLAGRGSSISSRVVCFEIVDEHVFPFIRALKDAGTAYAQHMNDARFTFPARRCSPRWSTRSTSSHGHARHQGRLYEYMLAKIATAGQNGQFRTPRHIIAMMVEMMEPKPEDVVCDPACGTCGFLVAVEEYLRKHHPALFRDDKLREHFHTISSTASTSIRPCCASAP